jgi:hypothetical protein
MRSPSGFKVVVVSLRKADVIEYDLRAAALRFQLESDDRINPRIPMAGAPGLNDALVGKQFDVPADD